MDNKDAPPMKLMVHIVDSSRDLQVQSLMIVTHESYFFLKEPPPKIMALKIGIKEN